MVRGVQKVFGLLPAYIYSKHRLKNGQPKRLRFVVITPAFVGLSDALGNNLSSIASQYTMQNYYIAIQLK